MRLLRLRAIYFDCILKFIQRYLSTSKSKTWAETKVTNWIVGVRIHQICHNSLKVLQNVVVTCVTVFPGAGHGVLVAPYESSQVLFPIMHHQIHDWQQKLQRLIPRTRLEKTPTIDCDHSRGILGNDSFLTRNVTPPCQNHTHRHLGYETPYVRAANWSFPHCI